MMTTSKSKAATEANQSGHAGVKRSLYTKKIKRWSKDEDNVLIEKQKKYGNRWKVIARFISGRTGKQCESRWRIVELNSQSKKKKLSWTKQEDASLIQIVKKLGTEKAAFDELVSSGWKFEEHPLLKPLTPEEIVDLITAQRVRARKIFDERKVKITIIRGGERVEIYAIKVTEISTCDCTYCSSVT